MNMRHDIDVTKPSAARVYDALLGGTENYPVDRQAADMIVAAAPEARELARDNRSWVQRVVAWLVANRVGQFLDLGSGLPTAQNVHQVAQAVDRNTRVVYVDNDPIVLAHGRALLAEDGSTIYADADLADDARILDVARGHLDFTRPIAVIFGSVLQLIDDTADPADLVARYAAALPPGSFLAISHITTEHPSGEQVQTIQKVYGGKLWLRRPEQVRSLFGDLEPAPPGLVDVREWPAGEAPPSQLWLLGGVARI